MSELLHNVKLLDAANETIAALRARLVTLQSWVEERDATIALLQARVEALERKRDVQTESHLQLLDERNGFIEELATIQATVGDTEFALRQQLAALRLTWTTARPTVAGRYWYKDLDGTHILMIERVHHTDLFVSYEGSLTPLNEYHGEFAGPIPLPTEGQQARGSSGGAANHGVQS